LPEYTELWDKAGHMPDMFFWYLTRKKVLSEDDYKDWIYQTLNRLREKYPQVWEKVSPSTVYFAYEMANRGEISSFLRDEIINLRTQLPAPYNVTTPEEEQFITAQPEEVPEPQRQLLERLRDYFRSALEATISSLRHLLAEISDYFSKALLSVLQSFWAWLKDNSGDFLDRIWQIMKAKLAKMWIWVKGKFEDILRRTNDGILKLLDKFGQMTPEKALMAAVDLYGFAFSMGLAAHLTATAIELMHPLKYMGIQQIPAMFADLAGFSRIAFATMGVVTSVALAQPMRYLMQDKFRPVQPDERLLREMAVKPDITIEQFRRGMAYLGYSQQWISAIEKTMYHEPRYFELKMMSEDEAAAEKWLFTKCRRAGFTEDDARIMVSSFIKSAARTQRQDYYRQAFYLYKEGFITREKFENLLAALELRPEAIDFARRAAELAYMLDYTRDMLSYYTDSYLKDIIDEDELLVSLVGLGLEPKRAWLYTAKAKVRKRPKPRHPVTTDKAQSLSRLQQKYVYLYSTQYRKGLISAETFLANLLKLGISADLAEVTVEIEKAKKGIS